MARAKRNPCDPEHVRTVLQHALVSGGLRRASRATTTHGRARRTREHARCRQRLGDHKAITKREGGGRPTPYGRSNGLRNRTVFKLRVQTFVRVRREQQEHRESPTRACRERHQRGLHYLNYRRGQAHHWASQQSVISFVVLITGRDTTTQSDPTHIVNLRG